MASLLPDVERFVNDPVGASVSLLTDPLDMKGSGGTIQAPSVLRSETSNTPIDQLTPAQIQEFMASGEAKGQELTGISSADVGKKRGEIRGKYEDILNAPSRGAARTSAARNADIKRLRASQQGGGPGGGLAKLQETQMTQDYAGKIGDVRQKEYLDALNKIEKQYRGAGADIAGLMGQYGSIGVGSQPTPQISSGGMFDTYLCTELYRLGMISRTKLLFIHILLIIGTIYKPAQTLFYLQYGGRLAEKMKNNPTMWAFTKVEIFDKCLKLLMSGRILKAVDNYEVHTRFLFKCHGFNNHLIHFDNKWSFDKLKRSFKLMWRIA